MHNSRLRDVFVTTLRSDGGSKESLLEVDLVLGQVDTGDAVSNEMRSVKLLKVSVSI